MPVTFGRSRLDCARFSDSRVEIIEILKPQTLRVSFRRLCSFLFLFFVVESVKQQPDNAQYTVHLSIVGTGSKGRCYPAARYKMIPALPVYSSKAEISKLDNKQQKRGLCQF